MKKFITTLAVDAGKAALGYLEEEKEISYKGENDIVTTADKKVESMIISRIQQGYPDHNVVSEEYGTSDKNSEFTWIIDPIDGTMNFAHNLPIFSVSIALARGNDIESGAVYLPYLNELFFAQKGKGAFLNNKQIRVSGTGNLKESLLFFIGSRKNEINQARIYQELINAAQCLRGSGSAAIDLCYLAAGRAEGAIKPLQHSWDFAAAKLIIEEAGGVVTDFKGNKVGTSDENILASNGKIHDVLLEIVK